MADISGAPSSRTMLRWASFVLVAANLAFISDYVTLGESPSFAEVVAAYGNPLVPVEFAKGICLVTLLAFLLFYVAALWPRGHRGRVYNTVVVPLALTSVLASGWFVAFRHHEFGLCAGLTAAGAVLAGLMFVRVAAVSPGKHSRWLRVPFSLHFGVMTLALLVSVTQWLNVSGSQLAGIAVDSADIATAFLAIAAVAGGFVALRYSDFVYPAVIALAMAAMFVVRRGYDVNIATDALIVFFGLLVIVSLAALALARKPREDPDIVATRKRATIAPDATNDGWYALEGNSSIMRM
jgi:hypothetical protein